MFPTFARMTRLPFGFPTSPLIYIGLLAFPWPNLLAQETKILDDFETEQSLRQWEILGGAPKIVTEGVTSGQGALELNFDPKAEYHGGYMFWYRVPKDWSAWDALVLDVTNPGDKPIPGYLLVADKAWEEKGRSYWNRHNGGTTFPPGKSEWVIPVRGLYRGEAGSRNNDIKHNIDPDSVVRLDFGFGQKGSTGRILIDNLRFIKSGRPAGIWAFDFGPPSQSLQPGWTAVTFDTIYSDDKGYGWGPRGGHPWNGAARDTTFGTPLIQDFCEAGGYNFTVKVSPGTYRITVVYENCGYWGGEEAQQSERKILVNNRLVWSEKRPDGRAHALYRFEDVEPVGVDIWDTYMKPELAKLVVLEAEATDQGLTIRCEADRVFGSRLALVAIHRTDDEASAKWLQAQVDTTAAEFRRKATCLDAPAKTIDPPQAWKDLGLVAWAIDIETNVTPNSTPETLLENPQALELKGAAIQNEFEPLCLAIRPLRDLGECEVSLEAFAGPSPLPARLSLVRYNTIRGFGDIAWRTQPHTLRDETKIKLPKDVTREFIVTVQVPSDAEPQDHQARLNLKDAQGKALLVVPVRLTVHPVRLERQSEYQMGFFGLEPPGSIEGEKRWEVLEQTLVLLKEHGMNAINAGPSWQLKGWKDGEPIIDYGSMDRFFALLRKHGFTGAINGYGGARFIGLHGGYQKGKEAEKVEKESGLPYEDAFMRAWKAVDAHARENQWPTIFYAMCDETRVREVAEQEHEFMKLMAKASAAFPKTVRTSGSYSVHFNTRPEDKDDLLYWHQRYFEALDISSLNLHDESVMDEAKRLGREIHIYNQGQSRYSFGLYQWSEYRKGVKARWQWHLNVLHGYQFFDLDGREPDPAMICYGRKGLYPTIHFERCREGAEDFYLYQTLGNQIGAAKKAGASGQRLEAASALLENLANKVRLNQREAPKGYDASSIKYDVIKALADTPSR